MQTGLIRPAADENLPTIVRRARLPVSVWTGRSAHPTGMFSSATRLKLRAKSFWLCSLLIMVATIADASAREAKQPAQPNSSESATVGELTRIAVFPKRVALSGPRRQMHLIVTGFLADGRIQDLTRIATLTSRNLQIARVNRQMVRTVANGLTTIDVRFKNFKVEVPVTVANHRRSEPVSFTNEVIAALTKHGCNSGACHGSPTGKGGFRLSLRGFDAELDTRTLVREHLGRRLNRTNPGRSLLLVKPTMQIAHGGGQRMRPTDPAFRLLHDWIAQGGRADSAAAPICNRIEVYPPNRSLQWPHNEQQFCVLAHFSDGSKRDVTHLADFSSSDEVVGTVDAAGLLTMHGRGETTILVRYLQQISTSPVTLLKDVDGFRWENPKPNNDIDRLVFEKLKRLQIPPSPICTDGEFLRRASLDLLGQLPTVERTTAFLADKSNDKRSRLVDELLDRPEFAEFWALKWGDLLRLKSSKVGRAGVHKFHKWLVNAMRDNMPYDRFVKSLLMSQGSTFSNPPANYFRTAADANTRSETTSQLFLGIRIQCAKCHNHPFERWTQDNYYGIGAFFSRVQLSDAADEDEKTVFISNSGEVTHPRTGLPMQPFLPLVGTADVSSVEDRRTVFVDWLTSRQNPYFAKVGVNRIWGHLMGLGIVEPVDDFRESNPPSHQRVLDQLATEFVTSGYDRKQVIRKILNSRTYQLSSRSTPLNTDDNKYFSRYRARMLTAEQLLDAICQVTGVPEHFVGMPAGTRATQLPSPDFGSRFLSTFGKPTRNTACECERNDEPNLAQALHMFNSDLIARKLYNRNGRISKFLNDSPDRIADAGDPPTDNMVLWLKADADVLDSTAFPADDFEAVARWKDQSGRGHHVVQPDPNRQPQFVTKSVGSIPAIRFKGKAANLHNAVQNVVPSGSPRTLFVVGKAFESSNGGSLFTFRRATGGRTVFAAQHVSYSGTYYVYSDGVNGTGNSTLPSETLDVIRQPFVTTFISEGAGKKLQVHLNGRKQPVAQPGAVGSDDGATGFTVGNREDHPGFAWQGDISEVLIYDRVLTPKKQAAVGTYLSTKYDLETAYPKIPRKPQVADADRDANTGKIINDLYLAAFCRYPTNEELAFATDYINKAKSRRDGFVDLFWAVMNSKEFVFQH